MIHEKVKEMLKRVYTNREMITLYQTAETQTKQDVIAATLGMYPFN